MTTASDRAESVGARPDVQRWIRRFRRLCREMPDGVHVYVANGTPNIMATDEDGAPFSEDRGSKVRDAIIEAMPFGGWDGGDW